MTGTTDSSLPVLCRELDETIDRLVPVVENLLQRISDSTVFASDTASNEVKLVAPLVFPDGIGQGQVEAHLFRWREEVRLDIEIAHNRVFRLPDGSPSDRKCFLNDFQASVTFPAGTEQLPREFERQVVSGISAARDAVQRHNRRHQAPWSQVRVTAA